MMLKQRVVFRDYLKATCRTSFRNQVYSVIDILGLGLDEEFACYRVLHDRLLHADRHRYFLYGSLWAGSLQHQKGEKENSDPQSAGGVHCRDRQVIISRVHAIDGLSALASRCGRLVCNEQVAVRFPIPSDYPVEDACDLRWLDSSYCGIY